MQFDYFYGSQAEQFSFYRIPKVLFTDPQFKPLSTDAKVLYGILLDRMSLSVKNHWLDEQSRVYIIFTTEEIMEALSCANQKACRLMPIRNTLATVSHVLIPDSTHPRYSSSLAFAGLHHTNGHLCGHVVITITLTSALLSPRPG